ncbi:MAG TPA: MIP family channel protein [Myxococcales bacterium]|nr:MIP family channel protein [Myxococcales bacterium]HIN84938.1 MIP family channel protein [Myxococcales bacterium]
MNIETKQRLQKVAAEMVGTFALVFAGCGAIMVNAQSGVITHTGVGVVFGAVVMVMIYATGHISGAHFNPAVTIAFASVQRFSWREVPYYIGGQLVAALGAAWLLQFLFGSVAELGATFPAGSDLQSLVLEGVLSFFLMFVIAAVATDSRAEGQMAGLAIGGTVALAAIFGGPISGASMNPARSLGPALVAGNLTSIWIYLVGPIMGAVTGAQVYRLVSCSPESENKDASGCC